MKVKIAEATNIQLDWVVANPGKVSRYTPVIERIHRKSAPAPNGCRVWNGKLNQHGYRVCKVDGKERRAHRVLFHELHPGTDKELVIMHSCDNPACVNPEHLSAGTVKDNMDDMLRKGRHRGGARPGNKNAVGNQGWKKGGVTSRYVISKLGHEVEVPEELE